MTIRSSFVIENKSSKSLEFHLEPECWPFSLESEKSMVVRCNYEAEAPSVQFSDADDGSIFGAVFPGDGDVAVEIEGVNILDGIG